jgi:phage/plasmid-associated DNA primase
MIRRIHMIKCEHDFSKDKDREPEYDLKLMRELPGIFNWVMGAAPAVAKNGFTIPESSHESKKQWLEYASPITHFIQAKLVLGQGLELELTPRLYQAFRDFSTQYGHRMIPHGREWEENIINNLRLPITGRTIKGIGLAEPVKGEW